MKKIYKYIVISILVLTVLFTSLYFIRSNTTQKQIDRYASYISDGNKELERREYGKALSSFAKAAETIPQRIDAYEKIVELLVLKSRFNDAQDVIEESTKVLSNSDRAKLNRILALSYYNDNQLEKSKSLYLDADKFNSSDEGYVGLAKVYLKSGDSNDSKKALGKVKAKEGQSALERDLLLSYLGLLDSKPAKERLEKWDLSLEDNKELTAKVTEYLRVLNSIGQEDLYNRAVLARHYINEGFPVLAIGVLESEVEKMAEYPDGLYFLGRAYFDAGKYSSATDLLTRALGLGQYTSEISLLLARINIINGDQNVAITNYENAISSASDDMKFEIYKEYIDILLSENSFSTAKSSLDKLVDSDVNAGIWPLLKYIDLYYQQRNYSQMKVELEKLAKISSLTDLERMEYFKWQITYEIENNQLASAKENLSVLRTLDRFNPNYYLLSARINLIENNTDKAREELSLAINYDLEGSVTDAAKRLLGRIE